MRIVQLVNGLPPEALGGTETYADALAKELGRQGHTVSVFSRCARPQQPEYELETTTVENVETTRINNTQRESRTFAQSYQNDTIAARFGQLLDRFKPDIVHVQHLMYLSTTCVHEAVRRAIPVVMTLHDYWLICQRGRFLKPDLSVCPGQTDAGCAQCFGHLLDRKISTLHRLLKPLLSRNSWLRARLRRLYATRAASRPVSLAAQGIRSGRGWPTSASCVSQSRCFWLRRVSCASSLWILGYRKRKSCSTSAAFRQRTAKLLKNLLDKDGSPLAILVSLTRSKVSICWSKPFRPCPQADLHIYGGEASYAPYPDERRFRSQLANSPHIRCMGRYDNQELGRILADVDVVIVPSIWYENAPLVIREAFLARTPVITADFGGMREWVRDGVDGLLFHARDIADLRRQISRCIMEPTLVPQLSRAFPAVRSIAEDATLLEQHYQRLVP